MEPTVATISSIFCQPSCSPSSIILPPTFFLFWATDSINHRVGTHLKFFKDATLPDLPQILHPGPQQPPAEGVQLFHRKPLQLLQEGRPKLSNQWPIIEVEVEMVDLKLVTVLQHPCQTEAIFSRQTVHLGEHSYCWSFDQQQGGTVSAIGHDIAFIIILIPFLRNYLFDPEFSQRLLLATDVGRNPP